VCVTHVKSETVTIDGDSPFLAWLTDEILSGSDIIGFGYIFNENTRSG